MSGHLDKDALEYIATLGQRAGGMEAISVPGDKVLVRTGQTVETHVIPPPRRHVEVHGYADLVRLVRDAAIAPEPELYHEGAFGSSSGLGGQVVVLLDRKDRRAAARLVLKLSDKFQQLIAFAGSGPMQTPQVVNALRFNLSGVAGAEALAAKIRKVDFTTVTNANANVAHGRESLGRSVEAQVIQAADIPEEVEFIVPVYAGDPTLIQLSSVSVRCGIHIEAKAAAVQIKPLADELDMAMAEVQRKLGEKLRTDLEGVPVFYGAPLPPPSSGDDARSLVKRLSGQAGKQGDGGCGAR